MSIRLQEAEQGPEFPGELVGNAARELGRDSQALSDRGRRCSVCPVPSPPGWAQELSLSPSESRKALALLIQSPTPMCTCVCVCVSCSVMSNSAIPWTIAHQAPQSMGFSRQEDWSG